MTGDSTAPATLSAPAAAAGGTVGTPGGKARRPRRRMPATWLVLALLAAGLLGGGAALPASAWDAARAVAKGAFAEFLATYEEIYGLNALEAGTQEYVIFLSGDSDPARYRAFFAAEPGLRFDREGGLPGTLVVTLLGRSRAPLERLNAQPFVKLAVRNRGAFFCH